MNTCLLIILLLFNGNYESLRTKLNEYLNEFLNEYSRYEYEILAVPQSDKQFEIDTTKPVTLKGNIGYISGYLADTKGNKTKAVVSIRLKLYKNTLVAIKDIYKGESLNAENIGISEADVACCSANLFENLNQTNSYQAKTAVKKNDVILTNMVEKVPIIKRGDNIRACVIKGRIRIDVDAIARQDGSEDEIITIITSDKKTFKARVIDQFSALIVE